MPETAYTFDEPTAETLLEIARLFRANGGRFEGVRRWGGRAGPPAGTAPVVNEIRVALPATHGTIGGTGTRTVTPASMTDIYVGSVLLIDVSTPQETVTVTAITATTFTAVFANSHSGSVAIVARRRIHLAIRAGSGPGTGPIGTTVSPSPRRSTRPGPRWPTA